MRSQNSRAVHHQTLTIMCPECYAAPGDPCFRRDSSGKRVELKGPPGHQKRISLAMKDLELPFEETSK